jgi:hypothetical protein
MLPIEKAATISSISVVVMALRSIRLPLAFEASGLRGRLGDGRAA